MSTCHARHYIGGQWRDSTTGATMAITDPGRGDVVGTASFGTAADAEEALAAAAEAFPAWSRTLPHERAALLHRAAALLRERLPGLAVATAALRVGYGLDPGVEYGPLINEAMRRRTHEHVADAVARGATVLAGGRVPDGVEYERGFYYLPTVLAGVCPQMRVMREETFGPVAPVMAVADLDEALYHANDSPSGLAAYVYTDALDQALYAAERLEAGGVGINVNDVTELQAPFGGWKQSGFGRELGRAALEACLETKHVRIGLQTTVPSRPSGATAADQPLS